MEFRVGDKVAKTSRGWFAPEMHRVTRVLTRFVELDDESRFRHDGRPYPLGGDTVWATMQIAHWTEKHTDACVVARALTTARNLVECLQDRDVTAAREAIEELRELLSKGVWFHKEMS